MTEDPNERCDLPYKLKYLKHKSSNGTWIAKHKSSMKAIVDISNNEFQVGFMNGIHYLQ